MTIIIDSNEPQRIDAELLKFDATCRREDLSTGDFLVGEYIIERKYHSDMEKRLTTEEISIWRQLDAMTGAARDLDYTPILLVEGERDRFTGVHETSFAGAFARIIQKGVSIVPTPSIVASARFLVNLDDDSDHGVESVRQSPSLSLSERPQHLTEGLPDVGPERALALLERFGNFHAVVTATEDELRAVDGIGPKTASQIRSAVTRETF